MIEIAIASEDPIYRESISHVLRASGLCQVVALVAPTAAALKELVEQGVPVVLFDAALNSKLPERAWLEVLPESVGIVVAGMRQCDDSALDAIKLGVRGLVPLTADPADLLAAITAVASQGAWCTPSVNNALFRRVAEFGSEPKREPAGRDLLTPRELQVVWILERGLSNKEIAVELAVEPQTVKNHVHNILDKLSLRNRVEIVRFAKEHGIANDDPSDFMNRRGRNAN